MIGGGYVWLDHAHLERGLALAPSGDFVALVTRGFAGTGFYRSLVSLSLSLDAVIDRSPWLCRTMTLLRHAVASVMLLVAGRKLGASKGAALVAALLFAVHPAMIALATNPATAVSSRTTSRPSRSRPATLTKPRGSWKPKHAATTRFLRRSSCARRRFTSSAASRKRWRWSHGFGRRASFANRP